MGAGTQVTMDMEGPIKIQVTQGALDAVIKNIGGIQADSGVVYLTAKSAAQLAATAISNTGVIQARTLLKDARGKINFLGGMTGDKISVGGTLDASAPNG